MNLSRLNSFLNWSMRIGKLFGIPIYLHITILFFLWPTLRATSGRGLLVALEFSVGVVLSILIHELGHALTAKRFKLTGLSITLHGFGGFASSSGWGTPKQELLIVLAGPVANFILGGACCAVAQAAGQPYDMKFEVYIHLFIVKQLGIMNLWMGALNLIPILPWDGGRALEAILWMRMQLIKATRAVAHLGMIIGPPILIYGYVSTVPFFFLFGVVGVLTSYMTLVQTGGIRFGEFFADRKARKEDEAARKRTKAKHAEYVGDVIQRRLDRDEKERLRKLFEDSGIEK